MSDWSLILEKLNSADGFYHLMCLIFIGISTIICCRKKKKSYDQSYCTNNNRCDVSVSRCCERSISFL